MELKETLSNILKNGTTLKSSGTTAPQKEIFQSPEKLYHANAIAVNSQNITEKSKIYTVCKMAHAGGLLAQTLPAFSMVILSPPLVKNVVSPELLLQI